MVHVPASAATGVAGLVVVIVGFDVLVVIYAGVDCGGVAAAVLDVVDVVAAAVLVVVDVLAAAVVVVVDVAAAAVLDVVVAAEVVPLADTCSQHTPNVTY